MYKAFKYRLYPTEPQKELIAKHIGSSRFVYNPSALPWVGSSQKLKIC